MSTSNDGSLELDDPPELLPSFVSSTSSSRSSVSSAHPSKPPPSRLHLTDDSVGTHDSLESPKRQSFAASSKKRRSFLSQMGPARLLRRSNSRGSRTSSFQGYSILSSLTRIKRKTERQGSTSEDPEKLTVDSDRTRQGQVNKLGMNEDYNKSCTSVVIQIEKDTCREEKQDFLIRFGKALYRYGATGFRTELYLRYISKALEIPADFATFPSLILTSFGVPQITTRSSRTFLDFAPHGYDMGKLYQTTKLGERLCDMVHTLRNSDQTNAASDVASPAAVAEPAIAGAFGGNEKALGSTRQPDPPKLDRPLTSGSSLSSPSPADKLLDSDSGPTSADSDPHREIVVKAIEDLDVILNSPGTWSQDWVQAMAFGSAGASAVIVIFSGSWLDVLISFLVGSLIGVVSTFAPRIFPNYVNLIELVSSLLTTIILRIIQTCMPAMCLSFVPIFLSCILIHLPGLSFTLSLLELSAQNLVSGTARLVSSLLIALLLAAGVVIGSAIPGLAQFFATGPGPDISNTCTPLDPVTSLAWVAAMFPVLTFSLTINMRASLQEAPVVFLAALCGFSTYTLCDSVWSLNSAASSALSSFVVGLVGNIYARCGGLAMVPVLTGILILVPGSKGVRGSLQMMLDTDIGSSNAVSEMFFVALWLNIGLLFSTVVVYPQRGSFIEGEHLFRGF